MYISFFPNFWSRSLSPVRRRAAFVPKGLPIGPSGSYLAGQAVVATISRIYQNAKVASFHSSKISMVAIRFVIVIITCIRLLTRYRFERHPFSRVMELNSASRHQSLVGAFQIVVTCEFPALQLTAPNEVAFTKNLEEQNTLIASHG